MIAYLRGKIIHKEQNSVILETGNIGYEIALNDSFLQLLQPQMLTEVFIFEQSTERGSTLFGLKNWDELRLFKLLVSVSGVGPRSALSLLNKGVAEIEKSIVESDIEFLASAPRIGRKTAERIIVELKRKIQNLPGSPTISAPQQEVMEALESLGYDRRDVEQLTRTHQFAADTTQGMVKEMLQVLGKK